MSQAGAATNDKQTERVARQIEQFKRKCGVHGEEALRFAYHAALPVALNPEFLHLLRINFFVDIERPLPYEVEFEFLLSSLCRQIDEGLYEIERDVRLFLLEGLAREFGQERMREVAMLLWEYVERQEPWSERVGLERAQQLTVFNALDPKQAKNWLSSLTKTQRQTHSPSQDWLIAIQEENAKMADIFPELSSSNESALEHLIEETIRDLNENRVHPFNRFVNMFIKKLNISGVYDTGDITSETYQIARAMEEQGKSRENWLPTLKQIALNVIREKRAKEVKRRQNLSQFWLTSDRTIQPKIEIDYSEVLERIGVLSVKDQTILILRSQGESWSSVAKELIDQGYEKEDSNSIERIRKYGNQLVKKLRDRLTSEDLEELMEN